MTTALVKSGAITDCEAAGITCSHRMVEALTLKWHGLDERAHRKAINTVNAQLEKGWVYMENYHDVDVIVVTVANLNQEVQ